ncbi:DNA primase [Bartonella sp. DGB1]|uniref:DNA primase n=1 Tax=Bartonella sp. DGB1 TaxID=3239807 RepID=UPI003523CA36
MYFSPDFLNIIRDRITISQIVSKYIVLDQKKSQPLRGNYWACCPFHNEKTPSFSCNDNKKIYYCFGCHEKGDIFTFVMNIEKIPFVEAVKKIANLAGVKLPKFDNKLLEQDKKKNDLYQIMQWASQYFIQQLHTDRGYKALSYLQHRQISPDTQINFLLGYAPIGSKDLINFLSQKDVTLQQIVDVGLAIWSEDKQQIFPRFRNRLIFPIKDKQKRIIAFGGRALETATNAKYLNSPETVLFNKSEVLYNFEKAKENTSYNVTDNLTNTLILVEGYMDTIALAQAGFNRVVASLGTALTEQQMNLLWSLSDVPLLCLDGDKAGIAAISRSIERSLPLITAQKSLRFLILPHGNDPDDYIKNYGKAAFLQQLSKAMGLFDMLWYLETKGQTFSSPENISKLQAKIQNLLFKVKDPYVKEVYRQELKDRLWKIRFKKSRIVSKFKKNDNLVNYSSSNNLISHLPTSKTNGEKIEALFISLLLAQPFLIDVYNVQIISCELKYNYATALRDKMIEIVIKKIPENREEFIRELNIKQQERHLAHLAQVAEPYKNIWKKYRYYDKQQAEENIKVIFSLLNKRNIEKEKEEFRKDAKENPELDIVARILALKNDSTL